MLKSVAVAPVAPPCGAEPRNERAALTPAPIPADLDSWLPRDSEQAWDAFLGAFAPLILQVVHLFERDPDRIEDCFVFACEHLRRDDLRRIRHFHAAGAASFSTWLRVVVRNLCLDWRRARFGRPRLPRSITRLAAIDHEIFRCLHFRGLSENEALHSLQPLFPGLTRDQFDDGVARIRRSLNGHQSWLLLTRRPRTESLAAGSSEGSAGAGLRELPDPRADPEVAAARAEARAAMTHALGQLSPRERLLVRLRFEQDLGYEQIARLTGLGSAAEVERALHKALEAMRGELAARNPAAVSVKGERKGAPHGPPLELP